MGKFINDEVLDAPLDKLIADTEAVVLFDAYSTNYATIMGASVKLAEYTPDTLTKANGDVSGRKVTVPLKTGVNILISDYYQHMALVNKTDSKVLAITSGTRKQFDAGDKADIPAFDIEYNDPAA